MAFTIITSLHLIIGEQAPKIYAIRRPESVALWCALPLKFFYVLSYPFLIVLSVATSRILRLVGIEAASEHDAPHSEAEIRALVRQAHVHGELTRAEHRLIHAIFEFDDMICRRVMVPRRDAVFLDVDQTFPECLEIIARTKHSRYPLCEDSLEHVIGIVHVKDLVGVDPKSPVDLQKYARPPHHVPETMPMSQLLRHFQRTHQLMAMVVDEHGTIVGVVTLENVMEQIVGSVEDEFDTEPPYFTSEGDSQSIVLGSTPLELVNEQLGLHLEADDVDTFAGALLERVGRVLQKGDIVELPGARAEVIEVEGARAKRIRVTLEHPQSWNDRLGARSKDSTRLFRDSALSRVRNFEKILRNSCLWLACRRLTVGTFWLNVCLHGSATSAPFRRLTDGHLSLLGSFDSYCSLLWPCWPWGPRPGSRRSRRPPWSSAPISRVPR